MSMRIIEPELTFEIETPLQLGESVYWEETQQALYFVDILAPAVFRLDTHSRALKRWTMPSAIGIMRTTVALLDSWSCWCALNRIGR